MTDGTPTRTTATCASCGFEAPDGADEWESATHSLGTLTRCPECGSTDVHSRG